MTTNYAPATMTRLRDLWTTALAGSEFAGTVDVYLGPLVSGDPDDAVFVGYDGDPFGDMQAVTHAQGWAGIGARRRNEEFDVHCCVLNQSGSTDGPGFVAAFERLYGIASVLFDAVHSDPSLGLGPGKPTGAPRFTADVRGFSAHVPTDDTRGVMPRVQFSVHVVTRI